MDIDKSECDCDGDALVTSDVATWKEGNPTGHYCDRCGYVFGYEGGYEP